MIPMSPVTMSVAILLLLLSYLPDILFLVAILGERVGTRSKEGEDAVKFKVFAMQMQRVVTEFLIKHWKGDDNFNGLQNIYLQGMPYPALT